MRIHSNGCPGVLPVDLGQRHAALQMADKIAYLPLIGSAVGAMLVAKLGGEAFFSDPNVKNQFVKSCQQSALSAEGELKRKVMELVPELSLLFDRYLSKVGSFSPNTALFRSVAQGPHCVFHKEFVNFAQYRMAVSYLTDVEFQALEGLKI